MKRTIACLVTLVGTLAAPSVARADGFLINAGLGPMAGFGGNFLGKPGDKTFTAANGQMGTSQAYPGFSGTEYALGLFLDVRVLKLVGIEVDFLRVSGKGSGDITLTTSNNGVVNNIDGSLQIQQTATHIPVLVKGVLPLPLVAPYIFVGPEFVFVSDNGATMSGALAASQTTNGAYSDNYKYWTFGFGMEIKLPVPDIDMRIPISIRGSVNPGVSDHLQDRWIVNGNNLAMNTQWQYAVSGNVGFGFYLLLLRRRSDDLLGSSEELEVHRVFERVAPQPVEAVALERVDETRGHRGALEGALHFLRALRCLVPRLDAVAARVLLGVDVDRDAVQVVGDLAAPVRVAIAEAADGPGLVAIRPRALVLDLALDARQRRDDLLVHRQLVAEERRLLREERRRVRVPPRVAEALDVAVMFRTVAYGRLMALRGKLPLHEVAATDQERLRLLGTAALGRIDLEHRNQRREEQRCTRNESAELHHRHPIARDG
jgi:hypothetical protein